MTKTTLLGAAAIAATMLATPALAQAVINEPGRCAAQFPNANCKNLGPGNPFTDDFYRKGRVSDRRDGYRQGHVQTGNRQTGYRKESRDWNRNGDWNNGWTRDRSGFWPADAAGDVAGFAIGTAGAAVGTAAAIAAAPFGGWDNSYASDKSWENRGWDNRGWDTRTYAQRNGFVCTPGTWFKGQDGRRHICQ